MGNPITKGLQKRALTEVFTMSNFNITTKQTAVMKALSSKLSTHDKPLDEQVDIDQLIDCLEYDVTKEALQFTLRSLAKRGFVQKGGSLVFRRGKRRVVWSLTKEGASIYLRNHS